MKYKTILSRVLLQLLLCVTLNAQTFNAAPYLAMGNTGIAQESVFSIANNPAGISRVTKPHLGLAYQSHFLSTEVQSQAVFAVLPFASSHAVGLSVNRYGLKEVSTSLTLRAAYTKCFGNSISTSVSVNYHRYYVRNYHNDQTISLDLGFQYYWGENLIIGALARNATSAMFQDETLEYIPEEYALGFSYQLSEQLQVSSDIYYDIREHLNFRGGFAFWFDPRLVIRGGAASRPTQYFVGVGLLVQQIQFDIASSFHPRLGTSPQLAVSYGF